MKKFKETTIICNKGKGPCRQKILSFTELEKESIFPTGREILHRAELGLVLLNIFYKNIWEGTKKSMMIKITDAISIWDS